MNTSLLTLRVRRKRDLVQARQRARQIGRLVGFDQRAQLAFACGVFEAACAAAERLGRLTLEFHLCGDVLQAHCRTSAGPAVRDGEEDTPLTVPIPCVQKRLPQPLSGDPEDLAWMVRKVTLRTAEDIFDELRQQNRETLRALADLQRAETKLAQGGVTSGAAAA